MRNNSRGGMQSAAAHYSIYCGKCGRPAARRSMREDGALEFLHFTKKGSILHILKDGDWKMKRWKANHEMKSRGMP